MDTSQNNKSSTKKSNKNGKGIFQSLKKLYRKFIPSMELNNQQLRYLSQASVLEEATLPYRIKFVMFIVTLITVIAILWASLAKVKEVAKTTGEIIPATPIQVIQHQEGGTVAEILVSDGATVQENDVLMRLSGDNLRAELERAQTKDLALRAQAERYSAFADFSSADFEKFETGNSDSDLADEQRKILESMIENRDKQKKVIEEQLHQKKENLKISQAKIETLTKNLSLTQEAYQSKKKLFKEGYMQKSLLIEAEKDLNSVAGELEKTKSESAQNKQAIVEFQNRLNSLESGLKDEALQKLSTLQADIAENQDIINKLEAQIDRLEIKAPVTGIVKGEEITTVGGVIGPGQKIMEIVPTNAGLIAEVKISPSDIGNIKIGQHCSVKITAFDYSRYGDINGKLISFSATTFLTKDGIPYYKGRIKLEKNYLGNNPKVNVILPGNVVSADIIIGDKSIMSYLLKPIKVALHSSFTEK